MVGLLKNEGGHGIGGAGSLLGENLAGTCTLEVENIVGDKNSMTEGFFAQNGQSSMVISCPSSSSIVAVPRSPLTQPKGNQNEVALATNLGRIISKFVTFAASGKQEQAAKTQQYLTSTFGCRNFAATPMRKNDAITARVEGKDTAAAAQNDASMDVDPAAATTSSYQGLTAAFQGREKLSNAYKQISVLVMEVTKSSGIATKISQKKKNAKTAAAQSQNAAAGIEAIVALRSSINDHEVPTFLAHVDATLSVVGVHDSIALDASKPTSNLVTQGNFNTSPLDFGVDGETVGPSRYILALPSTTNAKGKVRKTPLVVHETMLGKEFPRVQA
ncbi:hypothetical protein ACH5RR_033279 [Cinchona calisaya]|uniref:Uncharacterized protein n=1 Tax=Cinchona calisaya TaxID=153742 RepID=A0ABD2YKI4_9GENT